MVTREFICDACDEEFELSWNDEHIVRYCPFCGEFLDEEDEDEDDDDWDDYEDEDDY